MVLSRKVIKTERSVCRMAALTQLRKGFADCIPDACQGGNCCYPKRLDCGCSSVVERHVANVNVAGSSPVTRFPFPSVPEGADHAQISGFQRRLGS